MANASATYVIGRHGGAIQKVTFTWLSDDADGSLTKTTTESFLGYIVGVRTVPDDTDVPTDNYDLNVEDADGTVLSVTTNRDATIGEYAIAVQSGASKEPPIDGTLTAKITNAGNAKRGVIDVYIRPLPSVGNVQR